MKSIYKTFMMLGIASAMSKEQQDLEEVQATAPQPTAPLGYLDFLPRPLLFLMLALKMPGYRKKAHLGDTVAQCCLGVGYYVGCGLKRDYQQAAHWLGKAAEQGEARAQLCLAALHERGQGVLQDYVQAYALYNIAAENGNTTIANQATTSRDDLSQSLSPQQISEAQKLSQEIQRKTQTNQLAEDIM